MVYEDDLERSTKNVGRLTRAKSQAIEAATSKLKRKEVEAAKAKVESKKKAKVDPPRAVDPPKIDPPETIGTADNLAYRQDPVESSDDSVNHIEEESIRSQSIEVEHQSVKAEQEVPALPPVPSSPRATRPAAEKKKAKASVKEEESDSDDTTSSRQYLNLSSTSVFFFFLYIFLDLSLHSRREYYVWYLSFWIETNNPIHSVRPA